MKSSLKKRSVSLNSILELELKNDEFKLIFDQHKFYLQVAHLITSLRAQSELTQIELAKRAKVTQPLIARLEKGDNTRTPTFETVFKVLKALGYTMTLNVKKETRGRAA